MLVVGSERLTDWTKPDDRATAIIFADGAGAAVVSASDEPGIGPVIWGSDEKNLDAIRIEGRNGHFIQEGQTVFRWATTKIAPVAIRAAAAAGVALADIDVLVTHQANLRIIDAIAKKIISSGGRPDLKVGRDIVTTGNTSSASIPIALDRMRAAGEVVVRRGRAVRRVRRRPDLREPGVHMPLSQPRCRFPRCGPRPRAETLGRAPRENIPACEPPPCPPTPGGCGTIRADTRAASDPENGQSPPKGTTVSNEDIIAGLGEIVEEVAGVAAADVTVDKSFTDDLDIDSLSMVEIAVQAEDKFGVKIPDDELANLKTVGDAVDYIAANKA